MRLFTVVPEHIIGVTFVAFLALIFRCIPILVLAILYVAFLLYYTRGPDFLSPAQKYEWIAPCTGKVINAQCTLLASRIIWEHLEIHPHGLYAPLSGYVSNIQTNKKIVTITLSTPTGYVDIHIRAKWLPSKVIVTKGLFVKQGTLLAFLTSKSHITLSTEIYDQEWYIQKDDFTIAGQVIGHVKQLWNL